MPSPYPPKFLARPHSWNEERACIFLNGDPQRTPMISGMTIDTAEGLLAVLNDAHRAQGEGGGSVAAVGELVCDFVAEQFGRNTWGKSEGPTTIIINIHGEPGRLDELDDLLANWQSGSGSSPSAASGRNSHD